jgi:hypothetical protein
LRLGALRRVDACHGARGAGSVSTGTEVDENETVAERILDDGDASDRDVPGRAQHAAA